MKVSRKKEMAAPGISETENILKKHVILFGIGQNLKPKPTSLTLSLWPAFKL